MSKAIITYEFISNNSCKIQVNKLNLFIAKLFRQEDVKHKTINDLLEQVYYGLTPTKKETTTAELLLNELNNI